MHAGLWEERKRKGCLVSGASCFLVFFLISTTHCTAVTDLEPGHVCSMSTSSYLIRALVFFRSFFILT
jgi:hypothetical protein